MKRVFSVVVLASAMLVAQGGIAGESTRKLQQRLETAGFQPGPIDGIYGPKTRAAVRAFQVASELPASGWIDPGTRARLDEACMLLTEAERTTPTAANASPVVEAEADDARVDEMFSAAEVEVRHVRIMAVEVLGELRTTRARAALGIVLYGNTIPEVRAAAARKLGAFADAPSVYTLALALESEKDESVRAVIAEEIEKNLPVEPMEHVAMLSGAWEGELTRITPPAAPPSPWIEIEEPANAPVPAKTPAPREGSWLVASLDAPELVESHGGTLAPVEAVWGTEAKTKQRLATPPATAPGRPLSRGELTPTDDPRVVRGRARAGAYVVNVNGEPTRLDAQGYFVYRLTGEPRGEIDLVVQEIDVDGRTTERIVRLRPSPTTVAMGK